MSWTLESASNDLERYVLRGEPPSVDAAAIMVAWARCGMVGRQTCAIKYGAPGANPTTWGVCSRCGALVNAERVVSNATEYLPTHYCPNCGAVVMPHAERRD